MPEIRPIDANAAISELRTLPEQERLKYMGVYDLLKSMPTIDYEPVVRCKDCKHRYMNCGRLMCKRTAKKVEYRGSSGYYGSIAVTENHFCSYGAKMDEEVKSNANNNS